MTIATVTSDDCSSPYRSGVKNEAGETASHVDDDDDQRKSPSTAETIHGKNAKTTTVAQEEAPIYTQTQRVFSSLEGLSKDYATSDPVLSHEAAKTQARFGMWCIKLGPHRRDVYSLDERLRDASVVKRHVLDCLGDINDALEEAQKMSREPGRNAPLTVFTAVSRFGKSF